MNRAWCKALLVAALAVSALAAVPASAGASSYRFSGRNASAYGDWQLGEGSWRWAGVFTGTGSSTVHEGRMKPVRETGSSVFVWIDEYHEGDSSTSADDRHRLVFLEVSPYDASIDRDLTTARISGTWDAQVTEYEGPFPDDPEVPWEPAREYTTPMTVDLTWVGTSGLFRQMFSWKTFGDGIRWIEHSRRMFRTASLRGSISTLEGALVIDGSELQGELSNDAGGTVHFGEPW